MCAGGGGSAASSAGTIETEENPPPRVAGSCCSCMLTLTCSHRRGRGHTQNGQQQKYVPLAVYRLGDIISENSTQEARRCN